MGEIVKDREAVTTNGRAVFYAAMWEDFRRTALNNGWALALHGSLASDMDIMAMPWTIDAVATKDLIESLRNLFSIPEKIKIIETRNIGSHNRIVYTMAIWGDFYIDISVIGDVLK